MKQNNSFRTEYGIYYKRIMKIASKIIRQVYVVAFNIYAWVWLYRLIFIKDNTTFEDFLLWFFACVGMWFFVLDGSDKKLRDLYMLK